MGRITGCLVYEGANGNTFEGTHSGTASPTAPAPSGQVYQGNFVNGKPDGPDLLTKSDGEQVEQTWKNGELVR